MFLAVTQKPPVGGFCESMVSSEISLRDYRRRVVFFLVVLRAAGRRLVVLRAVDFLAVLEDAVLRVVRLAVLRVLARLVAFFAARRTGFFAGALRATFRVVFLDDFFFVGINVMED